MTNLVPMARTTGALTRRDPKRMDLFRRTKGKHLRADEIDLAIEMSEVYGANPLVNDIYFFVFNPDDEAKRYVVPVLSVGLYRKIAARAGDYRPDDRPSRFTYDEKLVGPDNPRGIVDCEVTVYKFSHDAWHPITQRVRWAERAPIVEDGADGFKWEPTGEKYPDGHPKAGKMKHRKVAVGEVVIKLDPTKKNWATMPETMLEKCTEVACIRKGWPNETAGSYGEGELDAVNVIDLTATEILEQEAQRTRLARVGALNTITIDWMDGKELEHVPAGKFHDRAMTFIRDHTQPGQEEFAVVLAWWDKNRNSIRSFWGIEKDAGLDLKQRIERIAEKANAEVVKP